MFGGMKLAFVALIAARSVTAHAGMSNFYVNGVDQGDAVCVRMNPDPDTWSNPINDLTSTDMACGYSGTTGVDRVCSVPDGATMTFEWREIANQPGGGVIDISHLGPCSVYMKKVDSAVKDTAAGSGWFKIWDEGYDETAQKWCTNKLIDNGGFLSVDVPKGLVGGYYLVRPELLALHEVEDDNNPQYYTGCAQIFLQSNGNMVPAATVSIPGAVQLGDPADSFNIYATPLALPYPLPGPPVTTFNSGGSGGQTEQDEGLKPTNCICESGSNFCGTESPDYDDEASCYNSSQDCWNQAQVCYSTAPPTGDSACRAFEAHCDAIQSTCPGGSLGPPDKGQDISAPHTTIAIPPPVGPTVIGSSTVQANSVPVSSVLAVVNTNANVATTMATPAAVSSAKADHKPKASHTGHHWRGRFHHD